MPHEELPYGGRTDPNSGYAGSQASEDRAREQDMNGVTADRQRTVLRMAQFAQADGITVVDVRRRLDLHHGQASGVLSGLHKAGKLARLALRRDKCSIYVLPRHAAGRYTAPHGQTSTTRMLDQAVKVLARMVNNPPCPHLRAHPEPGCVNCDALELIRHYENRSN